MLLFILLGFCQLSGSFSQGCTDMFQKSGVDPKWNDIRGVPNVNSPDECCIHCSQEQICKAFTYNKDTKICWLKHRAGSEYHCSNCIAGFKTKMCYSSGTLSQAIPDKKSRQPGILETSIIVSDVKVVHDVKVTVNIQHTYVEDLSISLIYPSGRSVLLFDKIGEDGDNFENTIFDQQASLLIANGTAPFNGRYQPVESLSSLNGEKGDGMWKLKITDHIYMDHGVLKDWKICLTTSAS